MWVVLAFVSAALLGLYDVAKKKSVADNDVLGVLLLNTLFSSVLFLPFIVDSMGGGDMFSDTIFHTSRGDARAHLLVFIKSIIVLTSWIFGYIGIKHLPITMVGPIQATRPVLVLVGAVIIYSESLNGYQWVGVVLSIVSLFLLARSGKKEGVDFVHNRYILFVGLAAIVGAASGLYDRYLMTTSLTPMFVESWYTLYQLFLMGITIGVIKLFFQHGGKTFRWTWAIPLISLFLSCADIVYLVALNDRDAMISVVSMIRRSSVVISFLCGALIFRERNLRSKAIDLAFIIVGMVFLYIGSH